VKAAMGEDVRFVAITLAEGSKYETATSRKADVIILKPGGLGCEVLVDLPSKSVLSSKDLPKGVQPMFTPEDCDLAEQICKSSPEVQKALEERYGITNIQDYVAADPWSVNLANADDEAMATDPVTGAPRRLVQTFLYYRPSGTMKDNQYAHPIDLVPVVDLNSKSLVRIDGIDRPAPKIPDVPVQYHRDMLSQNTYLQSSWRSDTLKALDITQPDGPSFTVSDGNYVEWQGWSLRVGFNYREGIVLHDVKYQGRPVMKRGSLVEMSVPYADPNPPYQRKCGTYAPYVYIYYREKGDMPF
jgi:primary-amine oxidase